MNFWRTPKINPRHTGESRCPADVSATLDWRLRRNDGPGAIGGSLARPALFFAIGIAIGIGIGDETGAIAVAVAVEVVFESLFRVMNSVPIFDPD